MSFVNPLVVIMVILLCHKIVEITSIMNSDDVLINSDSKTNLTHSKLLWSHKKKKKHPTLNKRPVTYNYTAIRKHKNASWKSLDSKNSLQFDIPLKQQKLFHDDSMRFKKGVENGVDERNLLSTVQNVDSDYLYHKEEEHLKPRVEGVEMVDNNFAIASSSDADFRIWRAPHYTFGQPWPIPLHWRLTKSLLTVNLTSFTFKCDKGNHIISEAFIRYRRLIFEHKVAASYYTWPHQKHLLAEKVVGTISGLDVIILKPSASKPHLHMDESYNLLVGSHHHHHHYHKYDMQGRALLIANETWGALRGLETFSQILWQTEDNTIFVNSTFIIDKPRFPHRGLLIDTARHFLRKETLLQNLDAMAYNKLNVFHWHLIDDQSFPFQSRTFPNLSRLGAFDSEHSVYTYDDIHEIVEYARLRGIRVIPELDSPGHTHGISYAFPHVMTRCYDDGFWSGFFGPVNPALPALYDLLKGLFAEIVELFSDEFVHLGADEVPLKCWESNPDVQRLMERLKIDRSELVMDYYMRNLQNLVTHIGLRNATKRRKFVVWQEAYDNGLLLKDGTIIQVWKGDSSFDLHQVARAGRPVIYSACWYLDRLEYGPQWVKFYECEPGTTQYTRYEEWHDNILGGEACMWMEYQSDVTALSRIWPLTSAVAERLWSSTELLSVARAAPRLEEHRCRMLQRGIATGVASGPGSCPQHANVRGTKANLLSSPELKFAAQQQQPKRKAAGDVDAAGDVESSFFLFFCCCCCLFFLVIFVVTSRLNFAAVLFAPPPRNLLGCFSPAPRRLMALMFLLIFVYAVGWLLPFTMHFQ